jgi:hypothetical protein
MYFQKKQEDDSQFFYSIESDDNGVVKNFFGLTGELDVPIKNLEIL